MKTVYPFSVVLVATVSAACGAPFDASSPEGHAGESSMGGSGIGVGHAGHAGSSASAEAGQAGARAVDDAGAGEAPTENGGATGGGSGSMAMAGTGGSLSTGGSIGHGGAGNSGGMPSGMGGTTSTGGSTSGGNTGTGGSVSNGGVSVQYKVVSAEALSSYISCELYVMNAGPNTYAVSELKVHYYYTDDVKMSTQWLLNWAHISTGGSIQDLTVTESSAALVPAVANADTYLELSFAPSSQSTIGPSQSVQFSWRLGASNPSLKYTQTNDYSFDASKTTQADSSRIVLLRNGTVLWGTPP